ncbi:MAG: Ig-like domain-containing protein, partial [Burkholderiales bacterium]|nr:Ig-like domain-containing protein [Burkholderiales bacterium]
SQGNAIPNTLVTFATSNLYTIISPSSGTALTNANGVASVNLLPKDLNTALSQIGTADSVKATVTINNTPLISTANFQFGTAGVTLALVAPSGGNISLNAYDTTLLKVDVLVNGAPYTKEQLNINFSSTCALNSRATMLPSVATANGRAEVVYADKGCGSTDVVTASFPGANPVTANIVVATPVAASLGFSEASPTDSAIVIKGAGGIGRSETATLTFIALDTAGKPLANQLVNFTVNSTQPVTLQTTSATTDANGKVNAYVNSGTLPTTFRVIASFANLPSISTVSGVITVSNGAPTQTAFTLTETSNNIEGWNIDNISNTVAILLADASGNPVVDGTPVVFTTDSGAIGSSANGGCVTKNGFCNVPFRSQNPRISAGTPGKRAGLATISASSTTALINISGQIGMFQSGSYATNVYDAAGITAYNTSGNTLVNTSCNVYSLQIEVNDLNFNPMPFGSKIGVTNASSDLTIGSILPATVPNILPHKADGSRTLVASEMAAHQGSIHTIPITLPVGCDSTGGKVKTGTFSVTITSPDGAVSSYPFSLPYNVQ